jgi:dolichol-phosphate mannosyltransferase
MIARLARFGTVGLSGSVLNLALFWLLTSLGSVPHLLAAALAFEAALCSNYVLNQCWTFADRDAGRAGLLRYQVSGLGGLAISLAALNLLTAVGVMPVGAQALGIAAAMTWNFALSLGWTWRTPSASSLQPA